LYDTEIEAVEERKGRQILGFTTRRFGFMFIKRDGTISGFYYPTADQGLFAPLVWFYY